jgi:RHS repeat-associated protein
VKRSFISLLSVLLILVAATGNRAYAQAISYESEFASIPNIDPNLPVGSLDGGVTVNLSGGASYEIPIKMAPGTAGMVPKLSLVYNSQGGNSILGKGWSLSGLSAISRSGRDYYHDGQATSIQWNNDDIFHLDGSRMHVLSGTNGAANTEYAPEQENYTRITQQGTFNNSPLWFNAILKDGTTIHYGELRSSDVRNTAGTEVLTWKISSMHDPFGNEIQYEYENVASENRLSKIYYTVNTSQGITASNEVRFIYKERSDKETYYVGGSEYRSNSLLEQIEVYNYEEGTVRKYLMNYFFDGDFSMLQRITEVGTVGTGLNSTVFQYKSNSDPYRLTNTPVSGIQGPYSDVSPMYGPEELYDYQISMDFNKDGYTDVVRLVKTVTQNNACQLPYPYNNFPAELHNFTIGFFKNDKNDNFIKVHEEPFFSICNTQMADGKSYKKVLRRDNFQVGDFDGDGVEDLAVFCRFSGTGSDYNTITSLKFYTNLKNVTLGGQPVVTSMAPPVRLLPLIDDINKDPKRDPYYNLTYAYTGDYDGDGVSEILTAIRSTSNNNGTTWGWRELQISSLKPGNNKSFEAVMPHPSSATQLNAICYIMTSQVFCSPVNISGTSSQQIMVVPTPEVAQNYGTTSAWVFSLKKDNSTGIFQSVLDFTSGYPTSYHGINVGDFNGDGLTDVLTKTRNANETWEIGYSNGVSFNPPITFPMGSAPSDYRLNDLKSFPYYLRPDDYTPMPDESPIITADLNGDGKTDIAHFYTTVKSIPFQKYANLEVYYSTGNNSFRKENIEVEADEPILNGMNVDDYENTPQHLYNNYSLQVGDFNGDGKVDLMNYIGIPSTSQSGTTRGPNYISIGAGIIGVGRPNRLLTNTRNGYGVREEINYNILNNKLTTALYEDNHASAYPLISLNGAFYVVSTHRTTLDNSDYIDHSYAYKNLLALKDGRGMLGFSEVKKTTPFSNGAHSAITVQANSDYLPPFYAPTIQESRKYLDGLTPGQLISSKKDSSQLIAIGGAGRFTGRSLSSQETNHLSHTTKYTYYQAYDAYNNPTQVLETIPGIEFSQREITYAPAGTTWSTVPYLPEQVTTTLSKNNTQTVSTTEFTTYYKGRVRTQKQFYNTPAEILTSYLINPTGTVATQGMFAPNEPIRRTYLTYDAKHRFVEAETNEYNETVTSTYDPRFGVVRTATGFDGLTTTSQYDDFGKLRNTIMPDGRVLTERWAWRTASKLTEGLIRKTVQDPAATTSYTDYNALGKETEHGTKIWTGSGAADWSRDALKYNVEGQLLQKIMPKRMASETAIELAYTYDPYGRVEKIQTQHGATTIKYNYSGSNLKTETTDPANRVKYTIKDGADKLVESKDESGILTYAYDGWGNVTQTKAGGVSLSTLAYDAYGRKTSITEPSSGTTSYTYTGFGELKTQTDAAGNTTRFEYDALGRMWRTEFPEGAITTDWYSSGGVGEGRQIRSITREDAQGNLEHSKTFYYDDLGRIKTTKYHNGRSTNWTYDALSRPATQTYVSGAMVRYTYKDGQVTELRDGSNTVRYRLEDVNGLNNATQEWRGNGKTTLQSYDYGNLTNTFTSGVQDYSLTHDLQRGLITRRTDGLAMVYDDFEYDLASRLTKTTTGSFGPISGPAPIPQVQTYGTNAVTSGNIVTKTDIGTYSYSKYHQVSFTNNAAGAIPTVQQDITYSSYHRPLTIREGAHDAEFTYDVSQERFSMRKLTNGALEYIKEYYDDGTVLYRNGGGVVTEKITPVAGGDGIAWIQVDKQSRGGPEVPPDYPMEPVGGRTDGAVVAEDSTQMETSALGDEEYVNYTTTLYYPYADHLGSIMALTDGVGTVVHRQAFDPWGRRRNVQTWATDDSQVPPVQFRWLWGYTGHEQLDAFGLVNMNARLYDPKLGRLLSVDNYVSDPASPMAYNRYTYANNNPISYVDPTGNYAVVDDIVLGVIGGVINLATNLSSVHSLGQGLGFFGIGFVGGIANEYITPFGAAAFVSAANTALGGYSRDGNINWSDVGISALSGAAMAGATSALSGAIAPYTGKLFSSISSPVVRGFVTQGAVGAVTSAFGGGLGALGSGGSFWDGVGVGAAWGFGIGGATGAYMGYASAVATGRNPWTGELNNPDPPPLPMAPPRSLGAARSELRHALNNIDQYTKQEIEQWFIDNGFQSLTPANKPSQHYNRPQTTRPSRIPGKVNSTKRTLKPRLDNPDNKTNYHHLHIDNGNDGYNIHLQIYPTTSPDVHIKHKQP